MQSTRASGLTGHRAQVALAHMNWNYQAFSLSFSVDEQQQAEREQPICWRGRQNGRVNAGVFLIGGEAALPAPLSLRSIFSRTRCA